MYTGIYVKLKKKTYMYTNMNDLPNNSNINLFLYFHQKFTAITL